MSDVSPRYLDGFLAAFRGGNGEPDPSAPTPPDPPPLPKPAILSPEERIKRELHPLDAWPRVLRCASTNQPPGADDRFRFQWFGLFYQGPERDAFLLRLRLPGGRLGAFQLAELAAITQELAGGYVLCNGQGGLDLPGVPVRDAAEIVRRVEAIGLRTLLTGGDCVQAVRGGEGAAGDALVCELEQALLHDRPLADLPGACEVVLEAADAPSTNGANRGDGPPMVVLRASPTGHQLTLPRVGVVGSPLAAAQVVPACLGFLRKWSEHGERAERRRAGLAEFCEQTGGEQLRAWLAESVPPTPEIFPGDQRRPDVARAPVHGVTVPGGRLLSGTLRRLADAARTQGASEVRLADGQLYFPGVDDPRGAHQAIQNALAS